MTAVTTNENSRKPNPWLVLFLVSIPVFIGSLDLTIVSAFLPEIIINFELPIQTVIDDAAWVITAYLLAYTVSMTFMGRVSDLIGRRRTYIACLIIFALGSFIVAEVDPRARTGVAQWIYNLMFRLEGSRPEPGQVALITIIIGRIVQALGAGAIVPISLALVGDLFPSERRGRPLGLIGAIDTLGWVLGHLYGGIMVQWFSQNSEGFVSFFRSLGLDWPAPDWRALFWINIPITIVALVVTAWVLRNVKQERAKGRFDFLGAILITGTLICLVLGLGANIEIASSTSTFSELGGLPPNAVPLLILSAVFFIAFLFVESRVSNPLFDLRIFKRRNLSMGSLINLFIGFCLMIGLVSVPILINIRLEDSTMISEAALQVGVLLSALTIPMALAAMPGGWLSERIGYAKTTAIGLGIALIGFAAIGFTWNASIGYELVALEMVLVGIGLGLTFSPISGAVIDAADHDKLGAASALVIIMRLLGMTISVSLLTALASQRLSYLAFQALGAQSGDPFAAYDVYLRLTIQVLSEMGIAGALICGVALIPALMMRGRGKAGV